MVDMEGQGAPGRPESLHGHQVQIQRGMNPLALQVTASHVPVFFQAKRVTEVASVSCYFSWLPNVVWNRELIRCIDNQHKSSV
eukprot:3133109-Amphidinium_carterae.1